MTISTKNKNIPKLRFPGFLGEWEEKKLGDICDYKNGGAFENNLVKNGKYNLITLNSIDIAGKLKKNHKTVGYADWYLEKDDLVMVLSDVAHGNFLGLVDIIPENDKYVLNQRMGLLRKNDKSVDLNFLRKSINKKQRYFKLHGQGSSQQNLSKGDILKFKILNPSTQEQQKIAEFLESVDEWVCNLRAQKESLTTYKKWVMQKIFSQEFRFKDDAGGDFEEWREYRLGDLCKITTGKLDANAMIENGKYRFYTCARDYYRIDNYAFDTEALLVSGNGANVGYVHYYKGKFNAYQRTYILDKFNQNIFFAKYFLDKFLSDRINKEKKEGNTPYIVLETLAGMMMNIPVIPEQQKIAEFLTSIDNLIESKQQQIAQAEQWEKGLMQGLFV